MMSAAPYQPGEGKPIKDAINIPEQHNCLNTSDLGAQIAEQGLQALREGQARESSDRDGDSTNLSALTTRPSKTRPSCSATCTVGCAARLPPPPCRRCGDASATICAFVRIVPSGSSITPLPLGAP